MATRMRPSIPAAADDRIAEVTSRRRRERTKPVAPTPRSGRPSTWWRVAVLAIATGVVYWHGLSAPFVFDDRGTIVDNRTIEHIWSREVFSAPHETPVAGRPVVNISFALNYAIDGRRVEGYRLTNIGIHVLCALALFGVAWRTSLPVNVALAVALLWALHPLNSEAVNYVTQRTESLMALFYLLTLYCARRAYGESARHGWWEAAAVLACTLGMASKESMVTAPLAVVLYDRVFLFDSLRAAVRSRARLYLGLAATWGLLAALVASAPRNLSAGFTAHDADPWTYLLNQAVMITRYLRLSVWPRGLVLYYGWPLPLTLADVLPQALFVLGLLALTAVALYRRPRVGILGLWFFLTLAPTSSILPIATEVGAERRMYVPLMALVVLAVVGLSHRSLVWGRGRALVLTTVAALLAAGTYARTTEYASSLKLAQTTHERWPTPASHSMLGTELAAAGQFTEAETHLRVAAPVHPPAQYYLGTVLHAQGRQSEAIEHFRTFIASQPPELDQVETARRLLADALTKEGRLDEAAVEYRAVLARHPDDGQALVQLGQIALRQQRFDEAIDVFRRGSAARPGDANALVSLGIAYASTGRLDEAIAAFEKAVAIDPQNRHAQQNLARARAMRARQ
jgi:protein O-mannosyl-transferase